MFFRTIDVFYLHKAKDEFIRMKENLKLKLSDRLYQLISSEIRLGEYTPGERIPTVRELARHYHVSNSTAAEAVRRLGVNGWITSSPKRGSIVTPVVPETYPLSLRMENRRDTFYFFVFQQNSEEEKCLLELQKEAERYHYKVIACELENEKQTKLVLEKLKHNAAGFICLHSFISRTVLASSAKIPLVILNAGHHAFGYNEIIPDNYNAGWATADYLRKHGHSKLGFITAFPTKDTLSGFHFRERLTGFSDYCMFFQLPKPAVYCWNANMKNGKEMLRDVIAKLLYRAESMPTAAAVGSLPMLNEIMEFAKKEFNIPDITRYMSMITYQDWFEDTSQTSAALAMIPLPVFARESIRLLLHLMNPEAAKHNYRTLISMEIFPGNTVHRLK